MKPSTVYLRPLPKEQKMSGPRLQYTKIAPAAVKALLDVEKYIKASGLEESLIELVKMRASQITGCAYCLDMNSRDPRKTGETAPRRHELAARPEDSPPTRPDA